MALVNYLGPILCGIFLAAPFLYPPLFPIAWVALLPLMWVVRRSTSPMKAFLLGWFAGGAANLLGFYWLPYTVRVFGGFSYGLSGLIFLGFAAYAALPVALFSLLVRLCGFGPLHLFPALFWVAIEFWFPLLFPWHLANSQSHFLSFIQSADLVGPYGTSFVLVWLNTILYTALFSRSGGTRALLRDAAVLSALLIGILLYGHLRLKAVGADMRAAAILTLAAIQGNIDIQLKWDPAQIKNNLKSYRELTGKAKGVRLVIWPETAVEEWLPENIQRLSAELLPALQPDASFIFGARSFRGSPKGPDLRAYNSAFLADAQGRVISRYHKQVLLAFGEYIPFSTILSKIPGIPPIGGGFTPGPAPRTLDLPTGVKVAPLICYEDLIPEVSRRFVAERGAGLLVNLTNDAWYGKSAALWQHARLAQWRAIETRRSLVRVTNTGLTSVINPRGEMARTLPTFTPGVLTAKVEVMKGETPYVRFGDWFAWMITLASGGILLWRCRRKWE